MYFGKLESIVNNNSANGVMTIRDCNADVEKQFYGELVQMCSDLELVISDVKRLPSNSYSHVNNVSLSRAWIDHCVVSHVVYEATSKICIDNHNTSDHFPMYYVTHRQFLG